MAYLDDHPHRRQLVDNLLFAAPWVKEELELYGESFKEIIDLHSAAMVGMENVKTADDFIASAELLKQAQDKIEEQGFNFYEIIEASRKKCMQHFMVG